ncbi:hypothetical protein HPDFL43_00024990 [Hoeflea phototrophica DFL-43]|uniref:Uncharacterized protein n=1 Tax=Hoeflea phototrophica (strain DSM 17068 / NCIMB 14078 / DFL-43) TaxID=411684 RepID=A0A095BE60_HOEPD|nr:hypothetical protein HPDFL43_00024990 [Hoeflea phototrophica DFL-43]
MLCGAHAGGNSRTGFIMLDFGRALIALQCVFV